jgi:ribose-phosphate pyrophosphokinase
MLGRVLNVVTKGKAVTLALLSGTASQLLGARIAETLGIAPVRCEIVRFPDGELHVELGDTVRGRDVFIIQATSPVAERHLMELFLIADACRRAGAGHLTAVIPYFGYARQDRRAHGREAVAARLVADLIQAAGIQRIVAVDVHTPSIEGFVGIPLEHLSAVHSLIEAVRPLCGDATTIVAPDLGATRLAERYGQALGLPIAIVHKTRISGEQVRVSGITGDVRGRSPIIVDDMISTAGTIEAAYHALLEGGCRPELGVVATHGLFVGNAVDRLQALPLRQVIVSDSVLLPESPPFPFKVISLRELLSEAVRRLYEQRSLADLFEHA